MLERFLRSGLCRLGEFSRAGVGELACPCVSFDAFQIQLKKREGGQYEGRVETEDQGGGAGVLREGVCSLEMEVSDQYNRRASRSL